MFSPILTPTKLGGIAICLQVLFSGQGAEASELYGALKKINDSNQITIGHRDASIPFSYYNENKQPVGYAIDLCTKVADGVKAALKKPDLRVSYVLVNAQTRIS